ncbi:hypothetical protein LCGC14_2505720 [marine sediment metagenome]|uniref:Uncharacterized protein n=1 Tax=marine sediment metagenome TaxID=412755 RepID=A0A0F9B1A7_9ZZZZ
MSGASWVNSIWTLVAPLSSILAISTGKIGRIWDEGFDSKIGAETATVLVLDSKPYAFCYLRLIVKPELLIVGEILGWAGKTVWWNSKIMEETMEIERVGASFVNYNTMGRPMIS